MMSIVYGPKWPFYSCWDYIALFGTGICRFCIWVELPVQRRLCPIVVRNVGSPDIHECFHGLTGNQRTPGFKASHLSSVPMQPYMKHELSLLGRYVQIRF